MATYRCPECGASHKELVPNCRLCGAPIENPITVRTTTIDRSVAADRFAPRGIGHFIWIGLGILAIAAVIAFLVGAVENATVERWVNKLPFVDEPVEDAWFDWADPNETMILEVPAVPVATDTEDAIVLDEATTETWTTTLGDDRFFFGYTTDLGFEDDSDSNLPAQDLLRSVGDQIAEQQGGNALIVDGDEDFSTFDGNLALDFLIDGLSLPDGPAWGSTRLVLADGEVFIVETIGYQRNPEPHKRMRSSLIVVSDQPDVTIPTIPSDAAEASDG